MWTGEFGGEFFNNILRQLMKQVLTEIEADSDSIDADEIDDMFDMIDVMIDRTLLWVSADQDRVNADNAAALPHNLDLLVSDVPLDIVKLTGVSMRHDERLAGEADDVLEPLGVDMCQIENHPQPFAFAYQVPSKGGEPIPGRARSCENPAATGGVATRMGEASRADTEFIKNR